MQLRYIVAGTLAALGLAPMAQAFDLGNVDIHGFVSQSYLNSTDQNYLTPDSQDGTMELNEIGINFGTDVADNIRVGIQLFARDQGKFGNNQVTLDWAYGDWTMNDYFGLRIGRMISTGGLYSEIKDYDFLRSYALLPQSIYNADFREISSSYNGAEAYGVFDFDGAGILSYTVGAGASSVPRDGDLATFLQNTPVNGNYVDTINDAKVDWVGSLNIVYETPVDGLKFLMNFNHVHGMVLDMSSTEYALIPANPMPPGPTNPAFNYPVNIDVLFETERLDTLILSSQYLYESWTFDLEYTRSWQRANVTTTIQGPLSFTGTSMSITEEGETTSSDGGYLGTTYRMDDSWVFGGYFSAKFADTSDRDGQEIEDNGGQAITGYSYDFAGVVRYDINEYWLVKAEAHYVNGAYGLSTYNDPSEELEKSWSYFILRSSFNF
ncbi:MAG: hypothetical protein PF961_14485 [Planctomycetota bacterium]|jgi:hypothetical protein|nr:hypothetical protein [Planctomycetota bacterium]